MAFLFSKHAVPYKQEEEQDILGGDKNTWKKIKLEKAKH